MVDRNDKNGKHIPQDIYRNLYLYLNHKIGEEELKEESRRYLEQNLVNQKIAEYDIVKDRRYAEDEFFLHVPITINYKSPAEKNLNREVLEKIKEQEEINIIGIDRGERNLIYVSLIDKDGNIKEQKNYNIIGSTDYHDKLEEREKNRDRARKDWTTIQGIKELKSGYLSQVVHEIAAMAIEKNAVIIMEDLNYGFKRGRFKFERQVYQKFEEMLIQKLNYFVWKVRDKDETGGLYNAYQLTNKLTTLDKVGKQCGIIFYVPAGYTSKIDPKTGFIDAFNMDSATNVIEKRKFFLQFNEIRYEKGEDAFCFSFDYDNFRTRQEMYRKKWEVYTKGERLVWEKSEKKMISVSPTEELKKLFEGRSINYETEENLLPQIEKLEPEKKNALFFDKLLREFKHTLQMRNSARATEKEPERDYIISPVKGKDGTFFESNDNDSDTSAPSNADANGAYHIALKGLLLMQKIRKEYDFTEAPGSKKNREVMMIKDPEWFAFAQRRNQ